MGRLCSELAIERIDCFNPLRQLGPQSRLHAALAARKAAMRSDPSYPADAASLRSRGSAGTPSWSPQVDRSAALNQRRRSCWYRAASAALATEVRPSEPPHRSFPVPQFWWVAAPLIRDQMPPRSRRRARRQLPNRFPFRNRVSIVARAALFHVPETTEPIVGRYLSTANARTRSAMALGAGDVMTTPSASNQREPGPLLPPRSSLVSPSAALDLGIRILNRCGPGGRDNRGSPTAPRAVHLCGVASGRPRPFGSRLREIM